MPSVCSGTRTLAGVRPFAGDSPIARRAHDPCRRSRRPLSELRPDLPRALTAPVMCALATRTRPTDPEPRPSSAVSSKWPHAPTGCGHRTGTERRRRDADGRNARDGAEPDPDRGAAGGAEAGDTVGDGHRGARRERRHRPRGRHDLVGCRRAAIPAARARSGCGRDDDGPGARVPNRCAGTRSTSSSDRCSREAPRARAHRDGTSALPLSACGSDEPSMTTAAATALQAQVGDARTAVANAQYARTRAARPHRPAHRATCPAG